MYNVYVNSVHDKAIIHRSSCSFVNDGQGVHPNASRKIDGWMTFTERDRAFLAAHKTQKSMVRGCLKCNPSDLPKGALVCRMYLLPGNPTP